MRTRITAAVAALAAVALLGVGLIVYVVESQRVERQTVAEVDQELDEFDRLQDDGIDPVTGAPFTSVEALVRLFLGRNVPDDDEALVGWLPDGTTLLFPDDGLTRDPVVVDVLTDLAATGGSTRVETGLGEALVTSQVVTRGAESGAMIVVKYVDEDRAELRDTMRTFAVVAVVLWLLVVAAAAWTSGRLLAPLRVLRETAEEIGDTDLSRRVPESGNDDITALTRTVNGMLARLEAAFTGQREFLDDAGHELKTPLTVLRGHLELLDTGNADDVAETRALLLDEVDRMARLVGDLILLAKSDRPDFVAVDAVDAAALTTGVLAKARGLGERRWVLDGVARSRVLVDEQRVTQALLQLCDNAVKHTGPGDTVAVGSSYDDDGVLRLWVRDTGGGVSPADRERIFDRFGRGRVPAGDEGFGLGLSIVAAIAAAHGGTVHVHDASPPGARFVVALPVPAEPAPTPDAPAAPPPATPSSSPLAAGPPAVPVDDLDTQPLRILRPARPADPSHPSEEHPWPAS